MPSRAALVKILGAAIAFGVLAALAKGQNTDGVQALSRVRSDLGNLSTPWLLVPFVAGTYCVRRGPPRLSACLRRRRRSAASIS